MRNASQDTRRPAKATARPIGMNALRPKSRSIRAHPPLLPSPIQGGRLVTEQAKESRGEGKACRPVDVYVGRHPAPRYEKDGAAEHQSQRCGREGQLINMFLRWRSSAAFLRRRCFGIACAKKYAESCDGRTRVTNPAKTRETAP